MIMQSAGLLFAVYMVTIDKQIDGLCLVLVTGVAAHVGVGGGPQPHLQLARGREAGGRAGVGRGAAPGEGAQPRGPGAHWQGDTLLCDSVGGAGVGSALSLCMQFSLSSSILAFWICFDPFS